MQRNLRASHYHGKGHIVQLLLLKWNALIRQRSTHALHMDLAGQPVDSDQYPADTVSVLVGGCWC